MKTKPVPPFVDRLTDTQRKRVASMFQHRGFSSHSPQLKTLATVLRHCLDSATPFQLIVQPKLGGTVQRLPTAVFPNAVSSFKDLRCQEAFIPCGAPAAAAVWHERDRRLYLMCVNCADHNVRNRGGRLVATADLVLLTRS